jgi:hypothetical protein
MVKDWWQGAVICQIHPRSQAQTLSLPQPLVELAGAPFAGASLDGVTLALAPFGVFIGEPAHAA